ncbi:MAG: 4-hydroxy-tetrahydrodipicolinate synthase [Elusimicrobia bacterium HGW-Elusimicrobia-1]|nr:MAG: 4-hydroxy-tetrahydrodipicolinate synthase [Elusimicrobia bacterium HGW-Elusimicrobia-1]
MFEGSCVAIVTPFKNDSVDFDTIKKLVDFHIANSTSWILPCGTTGESATLSHEEHEAVIEAVVKAAKGKIKVVAGTGSNNTAESVRLTKFAEKIGADAALLISPYYNKPTQAGLRAHFKAVASAVKFPIMLYNIQSRTGVNIEPETVEAIVADNSNVVGIKEASGSLEQMSKIKMLSGRLELLSGDDALTLPVLSIGGVGVVSVAANIIPADTAALVKSFLAGDVKKAREIHYKMFPLVKSLFIETNPIPVKTAMEMMGLCGGSLRLPMTPMSDANREKLKKAVSDYGLVRG